VRKLEALERKARSLWLQGLRDGKWESMSDEVGRVLIDSYDAGAHEYLDGGALVDETAFFERARLRMMRGVEKVEPLRETVVSRYGDDMTAILFLLFFDEQDDLRPVVRGVPARIAERARHRDVSLSDARRAFEIITSDVSARLLVRAMPVRTALEIEGEVRRAWNIGVADSAVADGMADPSRSPLLPAPEPRRLWEIREIMDERTRGNPRGIYRDDGFHWQVNGYVNTIEEIIRQGCVPPCGVNCRARLQPVPAAEARRRGMVRADGSVDFDSIRDYNGSRQRYIDAGLYPDRGYR
jgi:hypothetical protein